MRKLQIVIDTSAFVSALISRKGAAYLLLMLADSGLFEVNLSVPLVVEYEYAAKRILARTALSEDNLNDILDYICHIANRRQIYYLWRPFLRDPKDEMVLELAVAAGCQYIVTFNEKDFKGVEQFGLEIVTPKEFLQRIGQLP
ncbi:MAG: putative toxin-antitoxin system toxin component, PIN family [Chloroflexi bacterium]|nr:putative toxin-antitoxin system toxin component, PIN family [Chloroflexota bacterium]